MVEVREVRAGACAGGAAEIGEPPGGDRGERGESLRGGEGAARVAVDLGGEVIGGAGREAGDGQAHSDGGAARADGLRGGGRGSGEVRGGRDEEAHTGGGAVGEAARV